MAVVRYTVANGEIIAEKRGGVRRTYVPDPLGSTIALLDNTQTKTDTFSYWPYGEVQSRTGSTPTPFQFVGCLGWFTSSGRVFVNPIYLPKFGNVLNSPNIRSGGITEMVFGNDQTDLPPVKLSFTSWNWAVQESGRACCSSIGWRNLHGEEFKDSGSYEGLVWCPQPQKRCRDCATVEGYPSVAAWCNEVRMWADKEPDFSWGGAWCARNNRADAMDYAKQHCPRTGPLFDKCRHCMASCFLANKCGAMDAKYAGWVKEMIDLTDCKSRGFGYDDWAADLAGVSGAPLCKKACRKYGAF